MHFDAWTRESLESHGWNGVRLTALRVRREQDLPGVSVGVAILSAHSGANVICNCTTKEDITGSWDPLNSMMRSRFPPSRSSYRERSAKLRSIPPECMESQKEVIQVTRKTVGGA
jgi:hypothetical protein